MRRRPTPLLVAATAVALGSLNGCASRADTALDGRPLPGNQDTASLQRAKSDGKTVAVPKRGAAVAPSTPPPSTTDPAWTSDATAEQGIANLLLAKAPEFALTPVTKPNNKPALEIITLPIWLWVNTPALQTTVASTGHVIVGKIAVDKTVWSIPNAPNPTVVCDGTGVHNQGVGTPYDAGAAIPDPSNTANLPEPCITSFASPYYATDPQGTPTAEATYSLTGAVTWHMVFSVNGGPFAIVAGVGSAQVAAPAGGVPVPFRVGEIQALAVGP